MKKNREFRKVVSIFLISIFVTATPGCYSVKTLTNNDIPYPDKDHYILHGTAVRYKLINAEITDGFLTGTIENNGTKPSKNQTVHFYVSPPAAIVINGEIIKVPVENLTKIEVYEYSAAITGILVGVIVLTVVGMIYAAKNMRVNYGVI
jgi:hypothetical protein